jgi:hypothetical protein
MPAPFTIKSLYPLNPPAFKVAFPPKTTLFGGKSSNSFILELVLSKVFVSLIT